MVKIDNKDSCCGCEACTQICPKSCITMQKDFEGFLYPSVDANQCINCGLCEIVCPLKNVKQDKKPQKVLAIKNKNIQIRTKSSSGGIFYQIAKYIIQKGGIVYGAAFDSDWNVHHISIEEQSEIYKLMGSKYLQSRINNTYKDIKKLLQKNQLVLFTGCPCQVAGLNNYLLNKKYPNLITIDCLCHGVPSPEIWQMYLKDVCSIKDKDYNKNFNYKSKISNINFRDKTDGWRNYRLTISGNLTSKKDNDNIILSENHKDNIFMKGFLNNLYLRPSCYQCKFKRFQSNSDLTIGDYWGIYRVKPDFNDNNGVSMAFINTHKAASILTMINNDIEFVVTTFEDTLSNNGLNKTTIPHKKRNYFFNKTTEYESNISNLIEKSLRSSIYKRLFLKISNLLK